MSTTNYLKNEFLDIIWDENNNINQGLHLLESLAATEAIQNRENSSELKLDPGLSKKVKTLKLTPNEAIAPSSSTIKSTTASTRVKKFFFKTLSPTPTGKTELDVNFGMTSPANSDNTALFQSKNSKKAMSQQNFTFNWRGIPPRARPGVRAFTRLQPSLMRDCDLDRLRQHRRKVRQARRQMCFFWLFKKKKSKELSVISPAPITPLKVMTTPKIGRSIPRNGVPYLNIEGLKTPRQLKESAELRLCGRPHPTPRLGIDHNSDRTNYTFHPPPKRDSQTQTLLSLHRDALTAEMPGHDSLEVLTQMTAALTDNNINSMRSRLLFRNSMEGMINCRAQMSPTHELEKHSGTTRNTPTSYSGVCQLYRLSVVSSCGGENKGKKKSHKPFELSSDALATGLIKFKADSDEFSAKEIGLRLMDRVAAHDEDFNQRLVGTLWYLFEEYMMYPVKAYHQARQSYRQQLAGYSSRQSPQAPIQNKLRDFARVNHAFWQYVGALLNTLAHRDWLFDYLGVILSEFPNLVAWWKRKKDDRLGYGSGPENWQLERRVDEANALRAVRTSCYLICKIFDSKHNELELYQFCHGSIDDRKEENQPFGEDTNVGSYYFTAPNLQFKRGSCFEQLLEISKEEYGMGPTARLALTYVFSRVQMNLNMMLSLKRAREKDCDYFRVYRIPLRCYMMVWLKLALLQEDAKIKKGEKIRGKNGDDSCERNCKTTRSEIKQLADSEVRTVIALEHNTTIRELYFQLFPDLNTK
jgi:hypothetical protein